MDCRNLFAFRLWDKTQSWQTVTLASTTRQPMPMREVSRASRSAPSRRLSRRSVFGDFSTQASTRMANLLRCPLRKLPKKWRSRKSLLTITSCSSAQPRNSVSISTGTSKKRLESSALLFAKRRKRSESGSPSRARLNRLLSLKLLTPPPQVVKSSHKYKKLQVVRMPRLGTAGEPRQLTPLNQRARPAKHENSNLNWLKQKVLLPMTFSHSLRSEHANLRAIKGIVSCLCPSEWARSTSRTNRKVGQNGSRPEVRLCLFWRH